MMVPDPEKAIIAALVHYIPGLGRDGRVAVYPHPPNDWFSHDFLVVRATAGGSSPRPDLFLTCFFEVEAFSNSRGGASMLAREAELALARAAREGFRYEDDTSAGYLFGFREVNAPSIVYDGLSSKHADTFMFQGTYQISIRPLR